MAKTMIQSFEQAVTEKCTRALERGKRRVKLPAAVVRSLMVELHYHRKMHRKMRDRATCAEDDVREMADAIRDMRDRVQAAEATAAERYKGMVTLTNMINKMGEEVEKAEARATAAETYAKQAFEERNVANSNAQAAEQNMHKYRMDAIDAGLGLASANGATRNALARAEAAETAAAAATKRAEDTVKDAEKLADFVVTVLPNYGPAIESIVDAYKSRK